MALLSFANLREPAPPEEALPPPMQVTVANENEPKMGSTLVRVEALENGDVRVTIGEPAALKKDSKFGDNLAEMIHESELSWIADDLLRGIELDEQSRSEWMATRAKGLQLLGLVIEDPKSGSGSAPLEGMSRVRHPLLLEAVLRFQANAMGELLPADGPVKVRNDDPTSSLQDDDDADALERDTNHFLTKTAKEYYPDTDKLLFRVGLDGCGFKKLYHCPLKRRPTSESVEAEDFIVNNSVTDLFSANRYTHRIRMTRGTLQRMIMVKAYRNIELSDPDIQSLTMIDEQKNRIAGTAQSMAAEPKDRPYEVMECYCELDIPGFEHTDARGKPDGLAVPYKVVIEKTSRRILEIRRNWRENDDLCLPLVRFVKYPYVRGIGFYDIGLSHILGNATNAATASWREMLDAGMFACFPGFLYAKAAGRQLTNQFRIAPGQGMPIDTGGMKLGDAVMKLPYGEPSGALLSLTQDIVATGARVGSTAEVSVGEGVQNAPVGTTIALIEQATKLEQAVHKRLTQAQGEEIGMLVDLFREDPESLWRHNRKPAKPWNVQQFLRALDNYDLVPQADPNTSSHMQRILRAQALYMMAKDDPSAYDLRAVRSFVMRMALRIGQPDQFFAQTVPTPPPPSAKDMADVSRAKASETQAQASLLDAQTHQQEAALREKNANLENANRDLDRAADLHIADAKLVQEGVIHDKSQQVTSLMHAQSLQSDQILKAADLASAAENAGTAPATP